MKPGYNYLKRSRMKKLMFGLIVITAGFLLLGFNMGYLDPHYKSIIFSWKMLLVAFGLTHLFTREWPVGVILLLAGAILLGPDLTGIEYRISELLWPMLLIGFGLILIVKKGFNIRGNDTAISSASTGDGVIEEINIFSGQRHTVTTQVFQSAKLINIFGGSEIDLTKAGMEKESATVEMICLFGGFKLIIPADWEVRVEAISLLGGIADKRSTILAGATTKKLVIKGVAILGGGEISNS